MRYRAIWPETGEVAAFIYDDAITLLRPILEEHGFLVIGDANGQSDDETG